MAPPNPSRAPGATTTRGETDPIGSLSSTADSDLAALSSIVMTDVYGERARREGRINPATMLLIGRVTMVVATVAAVLFAALELNILDLLVFVGAMWGCLVFPVIASFYWSRVTNAAFTVSVLVAFAVFLPVRFSWLPDSGALDLAIDVIGIIGAGIVLGLMAFGFFGARVGIGAGAVFAVGVAPFAIGVISQYPALSGSLAAYAVSTIVCVAISLRSSKEPFDFALIARRTGDFTDDEAADDRDDDLEPSHA